MKFKFEKLIIWQKAMDFGEDINLMTEKFPQKEIFNLSSQTRRAVGQSNPEQRKFMGYAIRSLAEVITCLHKAVRRDYINEDEFNKYYNESYHLMNMMIAFRNKLK